MTDFPSPDEIAEELRRRIDSGQLSLPVLPAVAMEVLATVNQRDCEVRSLAEIVQRDPSLAAGVLRIANSARYAPKEPIVSLVQAIGRMGLAALRDTVMTVAVEGAVFCVKGHEDFIASSWRHARLTGQLAQEIARTRRSQVEAAFLCGLLHDVGVPVVLQGVIDIIRDHEGMPKDAPFVLSVVDALHGDVGAHMVEQWGLPAWVSSVARHHHDPAAASEHVELVRTVALANELSHWMIDEECKGAPGGIEHAEALDLFSEDVEELCERASSFSAS